MNKLYFSMLVLITLTLTACSSKSSRMDLAKLIYNQKLVLVPNNDFALSDYVYLNDKGENAFGKTFNSAHAFSDGLALVADTTGNATKWGYIDETGEWAIKPQYASATSFVDGVAFVALENSPLMAIDTKGQTLFSLKSYTFISHLCSGIALAAPAADEKCVIVSLNGDITPLEVDIEAPIGINDNDCLFAKVAKCDENPSWVGKTVCIDINSGKVNREFEPVDGFIDVCPFNSDLLYIVTNNEKVGIKDLSGKWIINPQYKFIAEEPDGTFMIKTEEDKIGWIDKKGETVIAPKYENASSFGERPITKVELNDNMAFIDKKGKRIKTHKYKEAKITPYQKLIVVIDEKGKYGAIDFEGKEVIKPQFSRLIPCGNFAMFKLESGYDEPWGVCDNEGHILVDPKYGKPQQEPGLLIKMDAEDQTYDPKEIVASVEQMVNSSISILSDKTNNIGKAASKYGIDKALTNKTYSEDEEISQIALENKRLAKGVNATLSMYPKYTEEKEQRGYYVSRKFVVSDKDEVWNTTIKINIQDSKKTAALANDIKKKLNITQQYTNEGGGIEDYVDKGTVRVTFGVEDNVITIFCETLASIEEFNAKLEQENDSNFQ